MRTWVQLGGGQGRVGGRVRSVRTHKTPAPVVGLKQDSTERTDSTIGNVSACATWGSGKCKNAFAYEIIIQKSPHVLHLIPILTK